MTSTLNSGLDTIDKDLPDGLDTFGVKIVRSNFTRSKVDITQTTQEISQERTDGLTGFTIFMVIFFSFFGLLFIAPNIWWLYAWAKWKNEGNYFTKVDKEFEEPPEIKTIPNVEATSPKSEGIDSR